MIAFATGVVRRISNYSELSEHIIASSFNGFVFNYMAGYCILQLMNGKVIMELNIYLDQGQ